MNQMDREQMQAAFRDMASMSWDFYQRLIQQGFKPQEALQLTASFLQSSFTQK